MHHSLSPVIHNAAFRALDLDWVYVAFDVPRGGAWAAVAAMRALGIDGLNVTMPHKVDAAGAVDRLSPTASTLGAVNTVVRRGAVLEGESTDGDGFLAALREDEGFDPAGRRCLVVGGGGAGRAVVHALGRAGAAEVVVVARRPAQAAVAARLAGTRGRVGTAGDAAEAELVVNATPVGMAGASTVVAVDGRDDPLPVPAEALGPGQLVVDLVYEPLVTPLVAEARARGAAAANGVGMLLHQAAAAFRLWTSEDPPLEVMSGAALAALAARDRNRG